ncbi:MAG: IS1 family transposase [Steroidobacteraceae bacterium]
MNKLDIKKRAQILSCLVEGNSIRATVRMTGAAKNTVVKLLADVGAACAAYQDKALRNLPCKRLQCDEIWSFVYAKAKNVPTAKAAPAGAGDAWTWTAIDADTKLIAAWMIGPRDSGVAYDFMQDLAARLANRVQLTTDGLKAYLEAVEGAFGADIDYAQLVKLYGDAPNAGPERKYSPNICLGARPTTVTGKPDMAHVSTSYVERQNLTMRMSMRRFTRLTNGFSKKLENLGHAVALHFMYYNFGRIHQSLRITPAMAASISDHVWELEEIAALADQIEE